jgi:3-dehydroquinate synthase
LRTIDLNTGTGHCSIITGGNLADLPARITDCRIAVITDKNVSRYYRDFFPAGLVAEIEPGEQSKNLETVHSIYEQLVDAEIDRKDFILGIGGGVVCDLAGFVASTYLRGMRFGFVASSLLAQVDAAIGGKNGVDFKNFKNIIGVIRQPEFVICDPEMLKTLNRKEFIGGLAEVIKYGAIMDMGLFEYCENRSKEILEMDPGVIDEIVYMSAANKVKLVEIDEFEKGERTKLNFGHTFAHALEKISGLTHGEAVAIGMNIAGTISVSEGLLPEQKAVRLKSLIQNLGLPVSLDADPDGLFQAIRKDKKKRGEVIGLVLLEDIGKSVIKYIELDRLKFILNDLHLHSK